MTIRLRLTFWYSCLLAATLIVFGCAYIFSVNLNTYGDMKDSLRKYADNYDILKSENALNQLDLDLHSNSTFTKDLYIQLSTIKKAI